MRIRANMDEANLNIEFTGEFFVPGQSGTRVEADHMERYKFVCQFVEHKDILDLACGIGYSAPLLLEAGANTYQGVDINSKLVDYANKNYGSTKANYYVGDICTFDSEKRFDVITCFETIEHVSNYRNALSNLYRLLKQGGILIISSPNRIITSPQIQSVSDKPANKFHTQEFIPDELLQELQLIGFKVEKKDIFGQRQRHLYKNKMVRRIVQKIFGNPDTTTSPMVTPVNNKVPRYFVLVAKK